MRVVRALFAALAAASVAGCAKDVRAVDLTIEADECLGQRAASIEVVVRDGAGIQTARYARTTEEGLSFPTGVRVAARDDASAVFTAVATLYGAATLPIAEVTFTGSFPTSSPRVDQARMLFDDLCFGQLCASGTCAAGRCVDSTEEATRPPAAPLVTCPAQAFVRAFAASGDCLSAETPCATVSRAITALDGAHGIIEVDGDGSYDPFTVSGSHLVVRAWPGTGRPTVLGAGSDAAIILDGDHLTLDGFDVTQASEHGIRVDGSRNESITVRRVDVYQCGGGQEPSYNPGGMAVDRGATDVVIEDSVFRDNIGSFVDAMVSGVHINDGSDVELRRNGFVRNGGFGAYVESTTGMQIEGNVFVENAFAGLGIARASGTVVNNRFCKNRGSGMRVSGIESLLVTRNSIVQSGGAAIYLLGSRAKRVELNILAFSGGPGLLAESPEGLSDWRNLYYENMGGDQVGFTPGAPTEDVFASPQFSSIEDCSLRLEEESPVVSEDESRAIGARSP